MRARAYCAHPSIRDHWALRCMSRCPDQVVSLNYASHDEKEPTIIRYSISNHHTSELSFVKRRQNETTGRCCSTHEPDYLIQD
ncbi:hypothetical protein TNCV_2727171 [Trichonephila clavipes]|nr:hypothetical protein TNCV_2727171 [Trichonephila clavipes]